MSDTRSVSSSSSSGSKKKSKSHQRNISVDKEKQTNAENEKLHRKFNLDPSEAVITTMKCSIKGRSGKIYVTNSHLCFISKIAIKMSEKKKIIAFSEVLEVEYDKAKQIVKLVKRNGKVVPLSFKESESAYLLIEGQWEASGNQAGSRLSLTLDTRSLTESGNHTISPHVKHFNLPETETLIKEYKCAQKGAFNHFGKLYVSPNYVCFYSAITSGHQKTRIKLRDVIAISMPEKSKNSIQIDTKTEKFVFTKFNDKRESVYDLLSKQYDIAKVAPVSQSNTPLSRSRSNSIDQSSLTAAPKGHFRKVSSNSSLDNNNTGVTITTIGGSGAESSSITSNNSQPNSRRNSIQITPPKVNSNQDQSNSKPASSPSLTPTSAAPAQTKIAQRLDKIENVSPAPAPLTTKPNAVKKSRTCCFAFF